MPHRHKKKKKDEGRDKSQICPLCGEQLDQLLRCKRCEIRVIASEEAPDVKRVLISGKLTAKAKANSCSKVTDRLGKNVTWAFGKVFTRDMEDGEATLAVKGDLARGKMKIKFRVPVSEGVYLRRVDITVDDETVCAVCCAVYGQDPRHGGPRRR